MDEADFDRLLGWPGVRRGAEAIYDMLLLELDGLDDDDPVPANLNLSLFATAGELRAVLRRGFADIAERDG